MNQNPVIKLEPVVKQRLDNIKVRLKAKTKGDISFSELIRKLILSVWNDKTRKEMQVIIAPEDLVFLEDTHVYGIGLFNEEGFM
ncbi:TPA_asm: hypothetical protein vir520_00048 [Caudoviricetes sp. vir520]|nr:TPA_asm: hypothetical protein vir520_00048 [Caudoviricetes sp. vir520]